MDQILTEGGHTVISRLTARDAMKLVAQTMVDLIVTDVYMPDKDGLEVILEAQKACPNIPVIAISGAGGMKNMLRDAQLLGAACTLQKPFAKQQLLDAVATVLASIAANSSATSPIPPQKEPRA
jgi:DNA-binding NtrC family response regulator